MTVPELPPTAPGGDPVLVVACREFVELVTEHLEGTLPAEMEQAVTAHLELCDPCVEYLAQMRTTIGLLRTLPSETLPSVVRNQLMDVYSRLHGPAAQPAYREPGDS
jgi:anti-sigma factor RsiW